MPDLKSLRATEYMKSSILDRAQVAEFTRPRISQAPPFKKYPNANRYTLPSDWEKSQTPLPVLLQQRRSTRGYNDQAIPLRELSFLLWASQGVTGAAGKHLFRAAPSAGALYPIETYVSVQNVEELSSGIYHFDPEHFELEELKAKSCGDDLALAALNQQFISQASVTFIWTALFRRNMSKYGNRGLRYILLDAGHICQNLLLAAESLELRACPVAAFFDDEINEILEIDGEDETVVYMASVGC